MKFRVYHSSGNSSSFRSVQPSGWCTVVVEITEPVVWHMPEGESSGWPQLSVPAVTDAPRVLCQPSFKIVEIVVAAHDQGVKRNAVRFLPLKARSSPGLELLRIKEAVFSFCVSDGLSEWNSSPKVPAGSQGILALLRDPAPRLSCWRRGRVWPLLSGGPPTVVP